MTEWVKISDIEAADGIMPLSAEDIPDTHTITVSERTISVDNSEIIQNNIKTDLIELVLDGEWYDCGSIYVTLGRNAGYDEPVQLEWEGTALTFPAQLGTEVGGIDVSVVGYGNDGEMRLVTKASSNTFRVVASGYVEGVPPTEENLDILAQIIQQGDAAEEAAEAANAAATSATSAATKANSAASSANTAASSANSAATKANSAAVDAQNAYDTLQPYMATIDSCANILHSEVGPDSVVTADDSFPCKPVEMTVYGNTVQNLWVNPTTETKNGVTFTSNADGSMTIGGTPTGGNFDFGASGATVVRRYILKPNTTYVLSVDKKFSQSGMEWQIVRYSEDSRLGTASITNNGATTVTFTTESNFSYGVFLIYFTSSVSTTTPVSGTYRVMLNEGSTAEPWCPPGLNSVGDDGSVDIVTAGKNLASFDIDAFTSNGVIFDSEADGSISVVGTATSSYPQQTRQVYLPSNVDMVASKMVTGSVGEGGYCYFVIYGVRGQKLTSIVRTRNDDKVTFNTGEFDSYRLTVVAEGNGATFDCKLYPQLELGSTATDYEPPNITTTSIDLQGHTLNALPDGTRDELHIDGGGNVVLEKRTGTYTYDGTESFAAVANEYWTGTVSTVLRGVDSFNDSVSENRTHCDKLPPVSTDVVKDGTGNGILFVDTDFTRTNNTAAYRLLNSSDPEDVKNVMKGGKVLYKLAEPQTIDLGTITPPTMAAPNVTAYVADDTPAEMSLDYVRDVNIVHSRLEERVAALELASATS